MSNQAHSFIGNLTRDPELKTVGENTVVNFSVAVNGRNEEDTSYYECEAWGKSADTIAKYFKKGKPIVVNYAETRTETWNDKSTGEKRTKLKFKVVMFGFVPNSKAEDSVPDEKEAAEPRTKAADKKEKVTKPKSVPKPEPESDPDDEDVPF